MRTTAAHQVGFFSRRRIAVPAKIAGALAVASLALTLSADEWISRIPWTEPAVVDPGPVGGPPSDAVVLFDGKDLSKWDGADKWQVQD